MRRLRLAAVAIAITALTATVPTAFAQSISCTTQRHGNFATTTCYDTEGNTGAASSIYVGDQTITNGYVYEQPRPRMGGFDRETCYDWGRSRFVVGC